MATFKVLLDKRRKLMDETYPLVIRIYNGRKFSTYKLKAYLKESQFDTKRQKVKKNHPNEKVINQRIKQAVLEVEKTALNLEMREEVITAEKIKTTIEKPAPKLNFIQYGEQIILQMRAVKRNGNANAYRDAINALKEYSGRTDLQFKEIDYELLCRLENKMLAEGLKKNSIAAYNRALRAIYNRAVNENLVEVKYYPYRKYKIRGEATAKRSIDRQAIQQLISLDLSKDSPHYKARDYFLLSFNLRGISFADMVSIKPSDIVDGRLLYKRRKTHKLYNIKLTQQAQQILDYYRLEGRTYILPVIPEYAVNNPAEERKYIQYGTKTTNKWLKKIGEDMKLQQQLTTYVARHSWATIAKKMGYSNDLIAESLGHSSGNRTTAIYLDSFDQEVIDAMNEQVCKF